MTTRTELYALLFAAETLRMVYEMEDTTETVIRFPVTVSEGDQFENYINQLFNEEQPHIVSYGEQEQRQVILDQISPPSQGDQSIICSICQSPPTDQIRTLPCGHQFCCGCITSWIVEHSRNLECPVCRHSLG